MIGQSINPVLPSNALSAAYTTIEKEKVNQEFLALFYKEILKQTFKPGQASFGMGEESSFATAFSSDLMVEQLALELARNQSFRGFYDQNQQEK